MYPINELEFIGESLPKINANFDEADVRLNAVESQTTQYSGLSSFYGTHSNNTNIRVTLKGETGINGEFERRKGDIVTNVTASKIIYPLPIYVHISHSETTVHPVLRFSYKLTSSTTDYTLMYFPIQCAMGTSTINDYSYNTFTLMDLGYYDWKINLLQASSASTKIYANVLYLA